MPHRAGARSQPGFTLIEMMVVLVIIAGLLTIAYASFMLILYRAVIFRDRVVENWRARPGAPSVPRPATA